MKLASVVLASVLFIGGCCLSAAEKDQLKLDVSPSLLEPPAEFQKLKSVEEPPVAVSLAIRYNG